MKLIPDNPYLLLTPGPLSTSKEVRGAMLRDWCTWDDDYNVLVQRIRYNLVELATDNNKMYTSVLMQGSGTFAVESVIGSVIPENGKILILTNGAYGRRMVEIAQVLNVNYIEQRISELTVPDIHLLEENLQKDDEITHVAFVHCETTTGILNPLEEICAVVKKYNRICIVDAMSSFGGIPMDVDELGIDFLISSANKCIQGVPGFGFVIARTETLVDCAGWNRSLSLSLYDQWKTMEDQNGKWRYTSPTHVVRAFFQALSELESEGGIQERYERYLFNQRQLVEGMQSLGFKCLLENNLQSPIITTFLYPESPDFKFDLFYVLLKQKGFVIYPGKVSAHDCFRIGNIGDVYPDDIQRLLKAVSESMFWQENPKIN